MLVGPRLLEGLAPHGRGIPILVGGGRASTARRPTRAVVVAVAPAAAAEGRLAPGVELLLRQHDPLAERRRDLLDEARHDPIARLAVQHAAAGVREIEPLACARDGDVHEAALLLD